ncbi:MAG: protein-glutamate O-methyltransferase family protein [Rikenellaceae bacterium]|nr:protein-glutamate O-methyltransferase family protein [Rikenellaceae bacterium]
MRNIKIFVGGSIQGLEKERNEINDRVNKFNIDPPKRNDFIEEQTFITVYSYANFGGQTGQHIISDFISREIDFAIFLFDGSKGSKCIGVNTQQEVDVVRQNKIPYEVFLTLDVNNEEATRQAISLIFEKVIDANKLFFHPSSDIVRILSNDFLGSRIRRHVDDASWANDNFAYYTIEARFKSTYDKEILSHKLAGVPSYKEFLNSPVFKGTTVKNAKKVRKELLDIITRYTTSQYGEQHYEYLRRLPFLVAEFYFYYYILYSYVCNMPTDYVGELDPYIPTKRKSLEKFVKEGTIDGLNDAFEEVMEGDQLPDEEDLQLFLRYCVNANTTDLSQQKERQEYSECNLLIDDTKQLWNYLNRCREGAQQSAICITDNCGPELYSDILLGLFLLRKCGYNEVRYQVKELPIFVSDTTTNDVKELFGSNLMEGVWEKYGVGSLEEDDKDVLFVNCGNQKRLVFESHREWHRPNLFDMSENFAQWNNQDNIGVIIVKGDMNYRRLVGDKNYDYNDTIEDKVSYIHKPLLVLRSLKSNVFLGGAQKIKNVRPDWKTSGEYGVVHFVETTHLADCE